MSPDFRHPATHTATTRSKRGRKVRAPGMAVWWSNTEHANERVSTCSHVPRRGRRDGPWRRRDREHDAEADGDDDANRQPHPRDIVEDSCLPEGHPCADQQDEVANQVELEELHVSNKSRKGADSSEPAPLWPLRASARSPVR